MTARPELLALLSALAASACAGEPVELFPQEKLAQADAGPPVDGGQDDDPDQDAPTSSCVFKASVAPDSTACTRRTQTQTCQSAGNVRTELSYKGCDVATGYTGDPADAVSTCEQAYAAESGVTSSADLNCHRVTADDPCCIDQAEAHANEALFSARVCVPNCASTKSAAGSTLTSCADTYAEGDRSADGSTYGMKLIGRACEGSFLCGTGLTTNPKGSGDSRNFVSSYGHIVFCAHGKLQLITEGPQGISASYH